MRIGPRGAWWVGIFGALMVRVLGWTWRLRGNRKATPDANEHIEVFWHGDLLVPTYAWRGSKGVTMISTHRDGELIAQTARRLGYFAARGSTTRGGIKAVLDLLRNHESRAWGVTPDGPRGPRGKVQEGVVLLASMSGRRLRPHGVAASFGKRFSSWDRFLLPYPFSRVAHHLGEPLEVPADVNKEQRRELALELEKRIEEATRLAQQALDDW